MRRDAKLRRRRPTSVRDGEWTVDDRQRVHVEDIAPRRRARESVVDEVEVRLLHISRVRRAVDEIGAKGILERGRVTQRSNRRPERLEGFRDPRRYSRRRKLVLR